MSQPSEPTDFDLTALRYLADELSPAEAEQFERLLAEDDAACRRFADAVELAAAMQAVAAAPVELAIATKSESERRSRWQFSAALSLLAASILFVIVGGVSSFVFWSDDADSRLAQSWVATSDAVDEALTVEGLLVAETAPLPPLDALADEIAEDDAWNAPPDWMLTAVALDREQALTREATMPEAQP
ncbi:MAG: hypothetical protein ACIALR_14090 [Blastopirellula sp. JB062]